MAESEKGQNLMIIGNAFISFKLIFQALTGLRHKSPHKLLVTQTPAPQVAGHTSFSSRPIANEPVREKTNNLGFRPCLIQTELYKHRRWLEAWNFGFKRGIVLSV